MAIGRPARLEDRNRRKVVERHIVVEVLDVFDVVGTKLGIRHDSGLVLERIADVAVGVEHAAWVLYVLIPAIAVVPERHAGVEQGVANAANRGWRNCERRLVAIDYDAIGIETGVVVVQEIVSTRLAIGFDRRRERLKVSDDGGNPRMVRVCALTVAAATGAVGTTIAVRDVPVI